MRLKSSSFSFIERSGFDQDDFLIRWGRARLFSLKKTSADDLMITKPFVDLSSLLSFELDLLKKVLKENEDSVLKAVFDNSRKLGLSLSRRFQVRLEIEDIRNILSQSLIPCSMGTWETHKDALSVRRHGCESQKIIGSFLCDWYREAIDGLIMGVGEEERFARHASVGHGDSECLDVFFTETLILNHKELRFSPVPHHIKNKLEPIQEKFRNMQKRLVFSGYAEGVLYYTIESENDKPLCGSTARMFHTLLSKSIHELLPNLHMQDLSPLAVYAEGT